MNPALNFTICEAKPEDTERATHVLLANNQSSADVLAPGTRYWLAETDGGQAIGVIGLELGNTAALLRSAGVLADWRSRGVGAALTQTALDEASRANYQFVYLFSTGAGPYWARWGFREVPVAELIAALPDAPQVKQYEELGWLPAEVAWRRDQMLIRQNPVSSST